MADMSAENAFLQTMEPSAPSDHQTSQVLYEPTSAPLDDEEDEYDPSNLVTPTLDLPASALRASTTPVSQPGNSAPKVSRARGGFVVSDDEDDNEEVADGQATAGMNGLLNGAGVAGSVQRSLTGTPNNAVTTASVPIQSEEIPSQEPSVLQASSSTLLTDTNGTGAVANSIAGTLRARSASVQAGPQGSIVSSLPKARLPQDRVSQLEDRIVDDPRGDIDAWLELMHEHQARGKTAEARDVYERYLKLFPSAAGQWIAYAKMELDIEDFFRVEQIFNKALLPVYNVELWSMYLDYVRRRNNLTTDTTGTARQVIAQAYDFVLGHIGIDKDAGYIWQDYVRFVHSGPGEVGGNGWQDMQKMDSLRKAYRQVLVLATEAVDAIWAEYSNFEMSLNKATGRKYISEQMPGHVTASQAYSHLRQITARLNRSTLPRLPPAPGFDGDVEHFEQMRIWREWIQWEKDDHLVLKEDDLAEYKRRILYVYKQATITMRSEPEFWYDAAQYCFNNGLEEDGEKFLKDGATANPESCLLAFRRADRLETKTLTEEGGPEAMKRQGATVREPYDALLNALYLLIDQIQEREKKDIARIQDKFAQQAISSSDADSDADDDEAVQKARDAAQEAQIKAIQSGNTAQVEKLRKILSHVWIALMRTMRRIQGKGKPGAEIGGFRGVLIDARKRGKITSDVYVASALIEHQCYKDTHATKIFERGMKLFPEDEIFALEYIKHLIDINDSTNARVVFETYVTRLTQKPEKVHKAKPLYIYFHSFESKYGELTQTAKLEKRMLDLFPEESPASLFAHRYEGLSLSMQNDPFDPTKARPIISLLAQARPKAMPSIEQPLMNDSPARPFSPQMANSPRLGNLIAESHGHFSPKRPLPADLAEDLSQPRKVARGESPLRGAAGRRLDAAKRRNEGSQQHAQASAPSLPRDITFFLSILPRASLSTGLPRINPQALMHALRYMNPPTAQGAGMQRQQSGQRQYHYQGR